MDLFDGSVADDDIVAVDNVLITILLQLVGAAVSFLTRDNVFSDDDTKIGEINFVSGSFIGNVGSDCGSDLIYCTLLSMIPIDDVSRPFKWWWLMLSDWWYSEFLTLIVVRATIRSFDILFWFEFDWINTPSQVIFIVVTILIVFVCHALQMILVFSFIF